jgi:hypothetical protein
MGYFSADERTELNRAFELKLGELTLGARTFQEKNITTLFVGKV